MSLTEVRTGPVGANFTSIPPIQEIKVRTSRGIECVGSATFWLPADPRGAKYQSTPKKN